MGAELTLSFVLQLDLPPGGSEGVAELAWSEVWSPLFSLIHHHDRARVGLAPTARFLDHIEQFHPEAIDWIQGWAAEGRVELVAMPARDVLLTVLPEKDAIAHLRQGADRIRDRFRIVPTGGWLPRRMWDPHLPRVYQGAGLSWTLVEELQLVAMGQARGCGWGVWQTWREGAGLGLVATDSRMSRTIPVVPFDQALAYLRRRAKEGHHHVTVAVEANRFGLRFQGDTSADQLWLRKWFKAMQNASWLDPQLPGDMVAAGNRRGRVVLPSWAPPELSIPALFPAGKTAFEEVREGLRSRAHPLLFTAAPFLSGAPWEVMLSKHPEGWRLYNKMLRVSREVQALAEHQPDHPAVTEARDALYAAQPIDAYFHAEHVGIYSPEARADVWRELLIAEAEVRGLLPGPSMSCTREDTDADGEAEIVLRAPDRTLVVDPGEGGGLTEWSLLRHRTNILDTITRRVEPYHQELHEQWELDQLELGEDDDDTVDTGFTEDEPTIALGDAFAEAIDPEMTFSGLYLSDIDETATLGALRKAYGVDQHLRASFVERFLPLPVQLEDLRRGRFDEQSGLRDGQWEVLEAGASGRGQLRCTLTHTGVVHERELVHPVRVTKRYALDHTGLMRVRSEIENTGDKALHTRFAFEVNLGLGHAAADAVLALPDGRMRTLEVAGEAANAERLTLGSRSLPVHFGLSEAARVWYYPLHSVHRDRGHRATELQGFCVVMWWPLRLEPGEKKRFAIQVQAG